MLFIDSSLLDSFYLLASCYVPVSFYVPARFYVPASFYVSASFYETTYNLFLISVIGYYLYHVGVVIF